MWPGPLEGGISSDGYQLSLAVGLVVEEQHQRGAKGMELAQDCYIAMHAEASDSALSHLRQSPQRQKG